MSQTEIRFEIDETALEDVINYFDLTEFQQTLLREIIFDNLDRMINSHALALISINPPETLPQAKWLEQLIHEIREYDISALELEIIPNPTPIILAYIAVAHLAIEL